jgi:nitroimidazol reductase NimA-like FMN-containing flavoprotein (pyridoxamine 5'-phosphate oxidase superfamily)
MTSGCEARRVADILELPYDDSEKLLRAGVLGRMVLNRPTGPEIVPVNYVAVGDAVLVRTSPGSLLDRFADGAALVFEVDHINYERWHGWSVVARGRGERVTRDQLTAEERRAPGPPAWVTRDEETWIRLRWVTLTGRRLGRAWNPLTEMPVRRASR